jgi:hypothetical protein
MQFVPCAQALLQRGLLSAEASTCSCACYHSIGNLPLVRPGINMCSNASIVAPLLERSRTIGSGGPRLLRLLCRCLFNGGLYTQRSRIARGAYAHVSDSTSSDSRGSV